MEQKMYTEAEVVYWMSKAADSCCQGYAQGRKSGFVDGVITLAYGYLCYKAFKAFYALYQESKQKQEGKVKDGKTPAKDVEA